MPKTVSKPKRLLFRGEASTWLTQMSWQSNEKLDEDEIGPMDEGTLTLNMVHGGRYKYYNVQFRDWEGLIYSDSPGRYANWYIFPNYVWTREA